MSQLSELLSPSTILLDADAADWREAIRRSGELLVSTGATDPAYTEAMIRIVEEHGPYIVVAPGFALAHSRPDESVHRTGMSFVRLAEPIAFGNAANDPVTLVMALAAADSSAHREALAALAGVLADPARRSLLDAARTREDVLAALGADGAGPGERSAEDSRSGAGTDTGSGTGAMVDADAVPSKKLLLTVCGNGLGTSLFLKNTAEQVLDRWGWSSHLDVQATDTISAKGRAKDSDAILTSGAIADTLGEVGVRVEVIENFTSQAEIDAALRRIYAV
ncbi:MULTISPECIES: PTS sugar transporter subunit IIA [Brachybacterium]|uniref:Ascorbate-specific PTS system EIIA component n=2 Tax=Brachybacterium TaxID=43668 RepID=A0A3R8QN39_9MICO|nr:MULTISPECIES: PTS sugar transporter subunit IIA [Brachybacterium]RRR18378.1 PTS sugar transporter [Brachybacterium paraconglomeratum]GLI30004.1 PTS sugar transporter [Brachybacterium conglomeratum]GLK04542.1 PTS sugar transporter [Brachybacterium conglomeratum]